MMKQHIQLSEITALDGTGRSHENRTRLSLGKNQVHHLDANDLYMFLKCLDDHLYCFLICIDKSNQNLAVSDYAL